MMPKLKPLPRSFYARDTHIVARELLGKIVLRTIGGKKISGRITEVEAYVGEDDLACHASRGQTARTEIMYGEPGHAYIYLIYGMYHCFNIVTEQENFPAAVLVRALEPLHGLPTMQRRRPTAKKWEQLCNGPGKLTQALAITQKMNNEDLVQSNCLTVLDDGWHQPAHDIATSPRIGIAYAGTAIDYPWRYFIKDSPFVSNTKPSAYSK